MKIISLWNVLVRNLTLAPVILFFAIFLDSKLQAAKDSRSWLSWHIPRCHFENLSEEGHVRIIEEIEWFRVAQGNRLPLVAVFDTGVNHNSSLLGKNWYFPLLESIAYPKDSDTYVVRMPNHATDFIFYKIGAGKYRIRKHHSSSWSADLKGDVFTVRSNLGDELVYKSGRLRHLKYSNERKIHFHYHNKMISEVRDEQNTLLFKVEKRQNGEIVFKFKDFYNKTKTCTLLIKQYLQEDRMQNGLSEIIIDGVSQKTFAYDNKKGTTTLEIKYMTAVVEKWRKNIRNQNPEDFDDEIEQKTPPNIHRFSWDVKTGIIKTEDGWRYTITPSNYEDGYAAMQREDSTGQWGKEFWYYDLNGKETILRTDGVLTEREWFTNGPAQGKEKSMTISINGKYKNVTKYVYDENGRLFSKANDGNIIHYFYDKTGNFVGHIRYSLLIQKKSILNFINHF